MKTIVQTKDIKFKEVLISRRFTEAVSQLGNTRDGSSDNARHTQIYFAKFESYLSRH